MTEIYLKKPIVLWNEGISESDQATVLDLILQIYNPALKIERKEGFWALSLNGKFISGALKPPYTLEDQVNDEGSITNRGMLEFALRLWPYKKYIYEYRDLLKHLGFSFKQSEQIIGRFKGDSRYKLLTNGDIIQESNK